MSDESLVDDVQAWLQKHGYVLEMEVARAVSGHASWVWQGDHYRDPTSDKLREIDVWGVWAEPIRATGVPHSLAVIFECKSTTAPWVVFAGNTEPEYGLGLSRFDSSCRRCQALEHGVERALMSWGPEAYAITQKREPKQADSAYEAVHQAVSATIGKLRASGKATGHQEDSFSTVAVPVVVTRSPLVICSLGEEGAVELRVSDKATIEVALQRGEAGYESYSVFVMSVTALDDFLERMTAVVTTVVEMEGD